MSTATFCPSCGAGEGPLAERVKVYCDEFCELHAHMSVGDALKEQTQRSIAAALTRIAVALEKLVESRLPKPDPTPECSICGANGFPDGTGHHPKCTNPQRR